MRADRNRRTKAADQSVTLDAPGGEGADTLEKDLASTRRQFAQA
jgi:hypothetical protein